MLGIEKEWWILYFVVFISAFFVSRVLGFGLLKIEMKMEPLITAIEDIKSRLDLLDK